MKFIFSILTGLFVSGSLMAQLQVADSTKSSLDFMAYVYRTTYAPSEWKQQFDSWDVEAEYQKAVDQINANPNMSVKEARKILMEFVYSMRDYHVSIRFDSTEEAKLPFAVRGAEGRFFIVEIDRTKLGYNVFPFNVGDEVISFNDKPVAEVVNSLKIYEKNVDETDQALAELALTRRRASRGFDVPRGTVNIGIKKAGKVVTRQLIWNYTPEKIGYYDPKGPNPLAKNHFGEDIKKENLLSLPMMMSFEDDKNLGPNGLGDKVGFMPKLGTPIWEASASDLYHAYIYKSKEGELIGVIRIPGYIVPDYNAAVDNFAKIIGHMQKVTDKLVIDQHNNPGGSVFYLYALASILSDKSLQAPRHIMSLTPANVKSCVQNLKVLESIDSDKKAVAKIGARVSGYPVTLQFVKFYTEYCHVMIEDWEAGKTRTRPFWIAGVDKINPNSVNYSKPILILVNELDFSGGDFFPTIMQDNQRATIMGTRTAGAGGYVLGYNFPNLLGVQTFRVTESLAYRVDQNPIENLGVTPDIVQPITAVDRQTNYSQYVKAVKKAIAELN